MHLTAQRQPEKQLLQQATEAEVLKLRLPKYECRSMNGQAEVVFKQRIITHTHRGRDRSSIQTAASGC